MKFILLSSILLIGLCVSIVSVNGVEEDEYFYDEGEEVPDLKFKPTPETTTTTTTTTTTPLSTKPTIKITTEEQVIKTTTIERNEPIKPAAEDNFVQSLNPKSIEIHKEPSKGL
jgi:hypothetical protein